jgi:hypothetical protein
MYLGTFGYVWVHVGTFGYIWVHLGTFGYIWVHLGTFGYISNHNALNSFFWLMGPFERIIFNVSIKKTEELGNKT